MNRSTRVSITAAVVALLVLVGIGAVLIGTWIGEERQRDLLQWESRLGLAADARADAINRLLAADRRDLADLAGNASLRFYLWQIAQARGAGTGGSEAAEGAHGYLRNLLLAAAERYGYIAGALARVPADVPQPRIAGLAILDADLKPVVATPGLELGSAYARVAQRALEHPADAGVVELMLDPQGNAVTATAVPISTVPGGSVSGNERPIGVVLAIRGAGEELYPLLTRGAAFAEDSEALLLEGRADRTVALLSPTRDGSPALRRTLPADRTDLAEAVAIAKLGAFVVLSNYRGDQVLQVSRPIRGQGWVLVQQVNAGQALSLADERRRFLVTALSLLLLTIVAVAVAAWRHGSSIRAQHHAAELDDKAARLERQTGLLHTITDSLDVLTLLVTTDGRVLFTNQAAADAAGLKIPDLLGRAVAGVVPPPVAQVLQEGVARMRRDGGTVHGMLQWPAPDGQRDYHASFIPVPRIGEDRDLALIVLGDVTDLQQAQKRHTELLRGLVATLVSAVDRRDPHAAHHGERVVEVADALARELGFSGAERETLGLAASLANIGKIMIPPEVLTKTEPLAADERALLQNHVDYGLELLKGLRFDGPVADIIAQKQERPDGRGYPRGIGDERITLAGQILAVANAFVALRSGRAYRQGMSVNAALDELMRGAGSQFDRRVIAALFHVAENRRDWSQWT